MSGSQDRRHSRPNESDPIAMDYPGSISALRTDADVLEPPIMDVGGYAITSRDLAFLQIAPDMVQRWREHRTPLGMDEEEFRFFRQTLELALDLDGIPSCSVRLRGSSTAFFAYPDKKMPWTNEEIVDLFTKETDDLPELFVRDRIARKLNENWPDPHARPTQRPFDVSFRLGIALSPSDYDLEISSDEIDARARALVAGLGAEPNPHRINNPTYDFINKRLVKKACEHLELWASNCSKVLRRVVTIAAFPSSGPPTDQPEGLNDGAGASAGWLLMRSIDG